MVWLTLAWSSLGSSHVFLSTIIKSPGQENILLFLVHFVILELQSKHFNHLHPYIEIVVAISDKKLTAKKQFLYMEMRVVKQIASTLGIGKSSLF